MTPGLPVWLRTTLTGFHTTHGVWDATLPVGTPGHILDEHLTDDYGEHWPPQVLVRFEAADGYHDCLIWNHHLCRTHEGIATALLMT